MYGGVDGKHWDSPQCYSGDIVHSRGTQTCKIIEYRSIHIETNSFTMFTTICKMLADSLIHRALLKDIQKILHDLDKCLIAFTYREANKADKLANFGRDNPFLYHVFQSKETHMVEINYSCN